MIQNQNMSKSSAINSAMPNMKKQVYEDDEPSEENKSKIHMQMANTGYDGFGGQ